MSAKYTSTEETTNYARICRLVIDVFPDVFRELLVTRLPSGLPYVLSSQKGQIISHLNKQQKKMLYPSGGVFQGSEKDMDISLLYILLRNLGNITPHGKGWGNVPDAADHCLSANIERLRIHRNEILRANNAYLSNSDLRTRWADIRQSVEDIQNSDLKTGMFVQAVDSILNMTMDPDVERKYITPVKKIEDALDKETKYKRRMKQKLETQNIKLTFIGHARAGKTCLMRQLLRKQIKPGGQEPTNMAKLLSKRIRYKLGKSGKEREKIEKGKDAELCNQRLRQHHRNVDDGTVQEMETSNAHSNDDTGHPGQSEEGAVASHTIVYERPPLPPQPITEDQRKAIEDFNKEDDSVDDPSTAYVTMFDFGGDEVFHTWHHCVMSTNSIYLLVFDVSLWENPDKQDIIVDEIVYWLNAVATYSQSKSGEKNGVPPIILIGSHMDQIKTDKIEICNKISDKLKAKPSIKDIWDCHVHEFFFLADMDKNDKNEEKYLTIWCAIDECVRLQSCWHEQILGSWLALENKIMLKKEEGINFLNIQQILSLNDELLVPLDERELVPFLRYLHNSASVFCFDIIGKTDLELLTADEKKHMKVILDINWIIAAFGAIITDTKFVRLESLKQQQIWKKFKDSAELNNKVLELRWSNITEEDRQVLLSVMECLGLITKPMDVQDSQQQATKSDIYIVPCLLKEASPDIVREILGKDDVQCTKTLCLIFNNPFVLQAIWDKTIAICLHEFGECTYHERSPKHKLCYQRPQRGLIYRNVDGIWNFGLHCKGQMLKLTMFNDHDINATAGVGKDLRVKIEGIIKHVLLMTSQGHQMFSYYLHCDFWVSDDEDEERKPNAEIFEKAERYKSFDVEGNAHFLTRRHWLAWFGENDKIPATEKYTDMTKVKSIHADMVMELSRWISPGLKERWDDFLTLLEPHLGHDVLYGVKDNSMSQICGCLKAKGLIDYGDYDLLREIVIKIRVEAAAVIDKALAELNSLQLSSK
ncbi:uncharacterized protein LOC117317348 isoform X2 [Pecten maximus]|uniref:uncharacterized protein LOC117317348 isoform X2 n=1 Tax=Pecten maximus TaxID=6579 RepID=UPI001458D974|nr:uncharacterized protein LOC117317348 isoform X2 [Pecten maximus]